MNELIVLPHAPYCVLAEIVSDEVQIIRKLNIPPESKNIIIDNGLIVSIALKHPMLRIFNQEGKMLYRQKVGNYRCINHKDNVVYLGGSHTKFNDGGEMFGILDLSGADFQVIEKELPITTVPGKSIDDILIYEDSLVLVDNIIFPKFLFEYDISVPSNPVYTNDVVLPNDGTYQHIIKGCMNDDWLILYSCTVGMNGSSQYIKIDGSQSSGQISTHNYHHFGFLTDTIVVDGKVIEIPESERYSISGTSYKFNDVFLMGDKLLIARTDGLFELDLCSKICSENMVPVETSMQNVRKFYRAGVGKIIMVNSTPGEYAVVKYNEPLPTNKRKELNNRRKILNDKRKVSMNNHNTNAIIGAIAGDIIGDNFSSNYSRFTDDLIEDDYRFTTDTMLTIAVADCILNQKDYTQTMQAYGRKYPDCRYQWKLNSWRNSSDPKTYNNYDCGSAIRVSAVGYMGNSLPEVLSEAEKSASVTHNHPEGIKQAQSIAAAIFLARNGHSKNEIRAYICENFGYDLSFTIDEISKKYKFNKTSQWPVQQAIVAFLESSDYEQAIRLAVSIDKDNPIACMAGGIAAAFYKQIPLEIIKKIKKVLPLEFLEIIDQID